MVRRQLPESDRQPAGQNGSATNQQTHGSVMFVLPNNDPRQLPETARRTPLISRRSLPGRFPAGWIRWFGEI